MSYNAKRIILNILSGILAFCITIMSIFLMLGIVLNIVYVKTTVRGPSMQPTLNAYITNDKQDGDIVFVNRFCAYEIGDIVVVDNVSKHRTVIKRLIGLEGDMIQVREEGNDYQLLVNGDLLYRRSRLDSGARMHYGAYLDYLDNHRGTADVAINDKGEECIKVGAGQCFILGDNWGSSSDSMGYGTVDVGNIVGSAEFIIPVGENVIIGVLKNLWEILT